MELVAALNFLQDRIRREILGRLLEDRLVHVWIEWFMQGFDPRAVVPLQHALQHPPHKLETFQQAGRIGILFSGLNRPANIIQDGQEIANERQHRVAALLLNLPVCPLAVIVHVGQAPQNSVAGLVQLRPQLRNRAFPCHSPPRAGFGFQVCSESPPPVRKAGRSRRYDFQPSLDLSSTV